MHCSWIASLCLVLAPAAWARPYSVDDMLRLESYGQIVLQPNGRKIIVERRGRYDHAASYDYDYFSRRTASRLMVADLDRPAPLGLLFPQEDGAGYWSGGFSPSGRRMVVFRLDDRSLRAGVLDLHSRDVRWLALSPDLPVANPNPVWEDDDHLIIATTSGGLPSILDFPGRAQRTLQRLWQNQRAGREPSAMIVGSGSEVATRQMDNGSALLLVDLRSGHARRLLQGTVSDFALSADRSTLAVLLFGEDVQPDPRLPVTMAFQARRRRLHTITLADGVVKAPCGGCDILPDLLAWAPQSTKLLFFARDDGQAWSEGQLRVATGRGGAAAILLGNVRPTLVSRQEGSLTVAAAWMADRPLIYGSQPESTGRSDWFLCSTRPINLTASLPGPAPSRLHSATAAGIVFASGDHLLRADPTGRMKVLATGALRSGVSSQDPYSLGSRRALGTMLGTELTQSADGAARARQWVDAHPRGGVRIPIDVQLLGLDEFGQKAVWFAMNRHGAGTLSVSSDAVRFATLDRINVHLEAVEGARRVSVQSVEEGSLTYHWLLLPSRLLAGKRAPLVTIPYPETVFDAEPPTTYSPAALAAETSAELLAAQGYAVLLPSMPLPRDNHDPQATITPAIDRAVDAALRTGWIDPQRLAIYGHSYGGYAALVVAASSTRYRAIVASAADANLLMSYGSMDPRTKVDLAQGPDTAMAFAWHETGQGRMGQPAWQDPQAYLRNSPFFQADRITSPVMLVHGDLDYVPVGASEQMFMALYRLGKDALLLRYSGEAHVLASPANIRDQYARIFAWLAARLDPPGVRDGAGTHDQARAHASRLAESTIAP